MEGETEKRVKQGGRRRGRKDFNRGEGEREGEFGRGWKEVPRDREPHINYNLISKLSDTGGSF
jgi:hypothetical protein